MLTKFRPGLNRRKAESAWAFVFAQRCERRVKDLAGVRVVNDDRTRRAFPGWRTPAERKCGFGLVRGDRAGQDRQRKVDFRHIFGTGNRDRDLTGAGFVRSVLDLIGEGIGAFKIVLRNIGKAAVLQQYHGSVVRFRCQGKVNRIAVCVDALNKAGIARVFVH